MNQIDRLERSASEATGLQNFGEDSYREGLKILVTSLEKEAQLNAMGQAFFDGQLKSLLKNRLLIEDWYSKHPEIEEQQIISPLIGLGLPRTGSTMLSCLLAEDPAVRFIRTWESMQPCPPPESATEHSDVRIGNAEAAMAITRQLFPRIQSMLPGSPTSPIECQSFMAMDFKSQMFQASAKIPTYVEWLTHKADLKSTYTYVKRILKLLQWRCPPTRWSLKNPSHILFIDDLNKVFPDARFWMTHRDICSVLPSVSDLYFEMHKPFSDEIDKFWLGEINTEFCDVGMKRVIAFRDKGNEGRFFDIHFSPFQRDPFPILKDLYDFIGEEFTEETRSRMHRWRENSPPDKHGSHKYEASDFGLDPKDLQNRFHFYNERFTAI